MRHRTLPSRSGISKKLNCITRIQYVAKQMGRGLVLTTLFCQRCHTYSQSKLFISVLIAIPVIYFRTDCYSYISALEHSLPSSSDEVGTSVMRDWRAPLLKVSVCIAPHLVDEKLQPQESYVMELVEDNEEFCHVSLQQVGVMATSKAINYFLHQPETTDYNMLWVANHGFGRFVVQNSKSLAPKLPGAHKSYGRIQLSAKRRPQKRSWRCVHQGTRRPRISLSL